MGYGDVVTDVKVTRHLDLGEDLIRRRVLLLGAGALCGGGCLLLQERDLLHLASLREKSQEVVTRWLHRVAT